MKKTNTNLNNSKNNTTNMSNTNTASATLISYERTSRKVKDLTVHPLINAIGTLVSNDVFLDFYREFQYLETPVVTEDGFVITHAADFIGAQTLKIEEIEVVIMKGANQDNIIRFISFKNVISHGKNRQALYAVIKYLTEYLTKTADGKKLISEHPSNKTRTVIADITGVSTGTIHAVKKIGDNQPELLAAIDNGKSTNEEALKQVTKSTNVVPFTSRKRYEGLKLSSQANQEEPKFNISSFSLSYKEIGTMQFSITDSGLKGMLNGTEMEDMIHRVENDNSEGETQYVQSHTFIPKSNDRFSIQVIVRDLDKLDSADNLAIAA